MDKQNTKRPKNEEWLQRRILGMEIIKEHNYKLTKNEFKIEYKDRIRSNLKKEISRNSIDRDIPWIILEIHNSKPSFAFAEKSLRTQSSKESLAPLAFFEKDISEIWLVDTNGKNSIIFDNANKQLGKKNFVLDSKKLIPADLAADSPIVMRIFFKPNAYNGIETVVCDIYEKAPNYAPLNLLSTCTRHHCAEIEFKKKYAHSILEFTYLIFNRYWSKKRK